MNTPSFGVTIHNGYAIIKINCKLNDTQTRQLAGMFPEADIKEIKPGLTRINAVMHEEIYKDAFYYHYKLAILRTQAYELGKKIQSLEECRVSAYELTIADMGAL